MHNYNAGLAGMRTVLGLAATLIALGCLVGMAVGADRPEPLISNGDMEEGDPPKYWSAESGAAVAADTDCHSSKQSLKISANGGKATQSFPVKPGTRYKLEFWYKCMPLVGRLYVYVNDGGPANLTGDLGSEDTWARWIGEFKTSRTSTATRATVGFVTWSGSYILVDDVSIVEIGANDDAPPSAKGLTENTAQAVTPESLESARQSALRSWRALFPRHEYVCWGRSPWERLSKVTPPPASVEGCKAINLAMGVNEYESASFVLTNLSDKTLDVAVSIKAAGIPIALREAIWVTTFAGVEVNDALALLEGKLAIPSGESREVWLTIHTRVTNAGDYSPQVMIEVDGLPSSSVNLNVKVYPVSLPDDKPIYTYYWDYVVPEWTGSEMARALVEDMKQHYVNVPVVHPYPSRLQLNPDGTLREDYEALDSILEYDSKLNPKMFLFAWNDAFLINIPGYPFFSDKWKTLFRAYVTGMVSHMKEEGWNYDKFAIVPYDERLDKPVLNLAKLIKEIDPNIRIYVNATGTRSQAKAISPYVDIWCPDLYDYLTPATEYNDKNLDPKLLSKRDQFFWTYANSPGGRAQEASPYTVYRLAVWKAWQAGMNGFGYWAYSYKTHWNSYKHEDGENWAVVYLANAKDAPVGLSQKELVVTSKRWEATRDGIEDFVYLRLLKDRVEEANRKASVKLLNEAKEILAQSPKVVLADPTNPALADAAKARILGILTRLSKGR